MHLDHSLFPDLDAPDDLPEPGDKADYVARVCGAWDFGLVPMRETFVLFSSWRNIFDCFPICASPSYTAFRMLYGWPAIATGRLQAARYERIDARQRDVPDDFAERT